MDKQQNTLHLAKSQSQYIETASGNKISRSSVLCASQNIVVGGSSIIQDACIVRGDLQTIQIGKGCVIGQGSIIRPPYKMFKRGVAYIPMTIGDNVTIGKDCIVSSSSIGNNVSIGDNCIIERGGVLKDCCEIQDNSVLICDTIVPPFGYFSGNPAKQIRKLSENAPELLKYRAKLAYDNFIPIQLEP